MSLRAPTGQTTRRLRRAARNGAAGVSLPESATRNGSAAAPLPQPVTETAPAARPPGLYSTHVGKKYAMAVSGMVLMLFVAATALRCDERITAHRTALERVLHSVDEAAADSDGAVQAADEAIRLALELDALERVQPRIDAWLRVTVGAVSDDPGPAPFGEGPA